MQQVDDTLQLVLGADRERDGDARRRELLLDLAERPVEIGPLAVEHVHEHDAREPAVVGPSPHAAGSHLDAHHGAHHDERPVCHGQCRDRVALEAGVAGRVEEVDLAPLPVGVADRGREGHLPLVLLVVPVRDGGAGLHGAEPVDGP